MQNFKHKKNYTPYPGFYDLRIFNLNQKEFSTAWRVQDFLYSKSLGREYYKRYAPVEWERFKDILTYLQMILLPRLKRDEKLR